MTKKRNDIFFTFNKETQEAINKTINTAVELSKRISKTIKNTLNGIDFDRILESFNELGNILKEANDDLIQFKTLIVEMGYPPSMELDIPTMRMIVQDYNEHGKEYVSEHLDDLMSDYFNESNLNNMLLKWHENSLLSSRLPILRSVIKTHNQQMFFASIPTLLPQLEGIVAKAFNHKGFLNGRQLEIYLKHLLVKDDENEFMLSGFDKALHTFYIQYILVNFKHGEKVNSVLSRHAILHGGYIEYGTKVNSLKLILLFDFLSECLTLIDEGTISSAKKEINSN